ncbi:PorT family protein [Chitinophaga oryzae]|uniref:PorT family protein n=1 Tax=Chitinophaga oryzae TaxID=2725414 RepID=A0AAE7DAJ7_9BACT|nr:porin family protein [Chitinophaga oryzae]QJB35387.1 PorT family protein [Chitinophaga oryzae]
MRKTLFVLLAVMSVTVGTYAQKKVHYGLKGGLNISNSTALFDYFRTGVYAGAFAEIKLKERWAIQPEVVYYRNSGQGGYHIITDRKEHYLSVPVMIKYYITPKFYLEAGPELNYILSANETVEGLTYNNIDLYNRWGLSGSAGLGYQLPYGFGVNARYSYSVPVKAYFPAVYNNTGKIGMTYTFK